MGKHSFGILINKLEVSDKILSLIYSLKQQPNPQAVIFYNELPDKFIQTPCLTLHMSEAWTYRGPVISTCHYTTKQCLNMFSPSKKFYYLWDLEWMFESYNYNDMYNIYMNQDLQLFCRSTEHKEIIEKCWKQAHIIEDFNYERIVAKLF